jgi:hypothetical protein
MTQKEQADALTIICRENLSFFRVEDLSTLPFTENEQIVRSSQSLGNVVFGSHLGAELGCPPAKSLSYLFSLAELPFPGKVLFCGKETVSLNDSLSFLQIIILKGGTADAAGLFKKRSLTGELPGYMARSSRCDTSVKIHKGLIEKKFSLRHIAAAIAVHYGRAGYDLSRMQLILGAGADSEIEIFRQIVESSAILLETEQKAEMKKIMEDCTKEANCGVCDDKIVCDSIRQIIR